MMRASRVRSLFISLSTRAVIPTLVAVSVAPIKMWTSSGSSGMKSAATPQPRKNGAMTPARATSSDESPTSIISPRSDSSPTSNSRIMTPISASAAIVGSVLSGSVACMPTSARLPMTIPPTSSPRTAGWFIRSKSSPPSLPTIKITATPSSTKGSSPCSPCGAVPSAACAALVASSTPPEMIKPAITLSFIKLIACEENLCLYKMGDHVKGRPFYSKYTRRSPRFYFLFLSLSGCLSSLSSTSSMNCPAGETPCLLIS